MNGAAQSTREGRQPRCRGLRRAAVGRSRLAGLWCTVASGQGATVGSGEAVSRRRQRANDPVAQVSGGARMEERGRDPAREARTSGSRIHSRDRDGLPAEQSELVRGHMAHARPAGWLRSGRSAHVSARRVPQSERRPYPGSRNRNGAYCSVSRNRAPIYCSVSRANAAPKTAHACSVSRTPSRDTICSGRFGHGHRPSDQRPRTAWATRRSNSPPGIVTTCAFQAIDADRPINRPTKTDRATEANAVH